MNRRSAIALAALFAIAPLRAAAADATQAPLSASESQFIAQIQSALPKRYATPSDAEHAGYHRYTVEDATGAISYANLQWNSTDPNVPAQLWYDVKGRLIGADYAELAPAADAKPESILGIAPGRFQHIPAHVHYVLRNPDGSYQYSKSMSVKGYADATGMDPMHPTAAGLVKAGRAASASAVAFVFLFPAQWDASVWVVPNPNGAFANMNPNVTPTANAQKDAG